MADQLPAELTQEVFRFLENFVPNERIDILDAESVEAIKNTRLQSRFWSQNGWRTFGKVLGQAPFFATKVSMAELDEFSQIPAVGERLTTLTFCGMGSRNLLFQNPELDLEDRRTKDFVACHAAQISYTTSSRPYSSSAQTLTSEFEKDLARILPRFPNLRHLRYLPAVEGHLKGYRWSDVPSDGLYIPEGTEDYRPLILDRIAKVLVHNNIRLESFSGPLKGNTNPNRDAVPASLFRFCTQSEPLARMLNTVQTLAINLRFENDNSPNHDNEASNIGHLLQSLHSARTLELACSNTDDAEPLWTQLHLAASLTELRVSFTAADSVDGHSMVAALRSLPNLRRLALGYVNLADEMEWDWVFELFRTTLNLDKLLLVEPLEFGAPSRIDWNSAGRVDEYPALNEAAGEVKVVQDRRGQLGWPPSDYLAFRNFE
ncbi:hypothetical protein BU16DRAFT_211885 [Lophium mytilinum]|uniref:Uncharacterized protein n=1 Tax=Lophium mytilinum TaxID=390894 RepID=A0A6A6RC14_9PEZI|nr:hypothetical protein BU16DRAFT_211885 [Lophium mytilinum]